MNLQVSWTNRFAARALDLSYATDVELPTAAIKPTSMESGMAAGFRNVEQASGKLGSNNRRQSYTS